MLFSIIFHVFYLFWRYFSCNSEMFHASAPSLGFSRMKFDCNINLSLNLSGVLDTTIVSLFDLGFFVAQYAENPRNSKKKSIRSQSRLPLRPPESAQSAKRTCVEETSENHAHTRTSRWATGAHFFFTYSMMIMRASRSRNSLYCKGLEDAALACHFRLSRSPSQRPARCEMRDNKMNSSCEQKISSNVESSFFVLWMRVRGLLRFDRDGAVGCCLTG